MAVDCVPTHLSPTKPHLRSVGLHVSEKLTKESQKKKKKETQTSMLAKSLVIGKNALRTTYMISRLPL